MLLTKRSAANTVMSRPYLAVSIGRLTDDGLRGSGRYSASNASHASESVGSRWSAGIGRSGGAVTCRAGRSRTLFRMNSGCIVETDKEATKTGDSGPCAVADGTADHHTTHPTVTV